MSKEIEEIRSQIDGLVEKVADLAMQDLRDTISAGEEKSSFCLLYTSPSPRD